MTAVGALTMVDCVAAPDGRGSSHCLREAVPEVLRKPLPFCGKTPDIFSEAAPLCATYRALTSPERAWTWVPSTTYHCAVDAGTLRDRWCLLSLPRLYICLLALSLFLLLLLLSTTASLPR
uniref:Uncharacterized protein n=1 Tax=Eutreptiella gymnastica TaxID=73025 RepID=A0A7S4CD14_9EUGL